MNRLKGIGIDDFRQEHIFPHVGAVLILAFATYTRSTHLSEAIDVDCLDAKSFFQFATDAPSPRLCTEEAYTKFQVAGAHAHLRHHFSQTECVGWCAGHGCRTKVLHQHKLLLGITSRCRQLDGAESLYSTMYAKTSGEKSISVADLNDIARADITYRQHASYTFGPHIEVGFSISAHNGFASGSRRGMDTTNLLHRNSLKAERIFITKVIFGRKRQFGDVVHTFDVFGLDTQFVHLTLVERYGFVATFYGSHKTLTLEFTHRLTVHALHRWIVNSWHFAEIMRIRNRY